MKTAVYNLKGEKVEELELNPFLFEVTGKTSLIHQVMTAQMNNARKAIAHTKDRSEVRGGGKKPWKQKGTGRARHGSSRSPLWIGGGVTFGPRNDRNFSEKVNKKMKNLALRVVLSDKAKEGLLVVVDSLKLAEQKTKKAVEVLKNLPLKEQKAVIALSREDDKLVKLVKNLKNVYALGANSLNIVDLLKYKYLVISKEGLKEVEKVYGQKVK